MGSNPTAAFCFFPKTGQSVSLRANKARFYFIQSETAYKMLEACPDTQWRLIFGQGIAREPTEILVKSELKSEMKIVG